MATNFSVRVNDFDLARLRNKFGGLVKNADRAIMRANNRTLGKAATISSRAIRDDIAVKATPLNKRFIRKKAKINDLTAILAMRQEGLLLAFFSFRELRRGGVSVKVFARGARYKNPQAYVIPRLRYTRTPKGAPAVRKPLVRNAARPSDFLYGPSYSQTFAYNIDQEEFLRILNNEQQRFLLEQARLLIR